MTSTDMPKLSVRSIADLISVVPYLLGFHPADSIVVVAFRAKKLVFAARGDLLPVGASQEDQNAVAAHLAAIVRRQDTDAVTVIGYGPADRVTRAVDAVGTAADRVGLGVLDALRVTDGRYWSYTCDDQRCCPPEGIAYDPTASQIAAAATYAGQVALPDREALRRQVAPVDGPARESMCQATDRAGQRLAELLDTAPPDDLLGRRALRRLGEPAVRDAMDRYRDGGRLSDDEVAWLSLLLVHIPLRDYAWERIDDASWQITLWTDMLRRAEPEVVAAPASLLAFAAWRAGQGALAAVAVERALSSAPDYSMALLLEKALQTGLPPSSCGEWPSRSGRGRADRTERGRADRPGRDSRGSRQPRQPRRPRRPRGPSQSRGSRQPGPGRP